MSDTSISNILSYDYDWLSGSATVQAGWNSAPSSPAPSGSSSPEYTPDEIIVKFNPGVTVQPYLLSTNSQNINALFQRIGVKTIENVFHGRPRQSLNNLPDLSNIYRLRIAPGQNLLAIIDELKKDPSVAYAEPNYIRHTCDTVPTDPLYSQQWALPMIQAPAAWDIEQGDPNVVVAVIDTGVDYNHPDLVANIWTNESEVPDNGMDDDGNGFVDDYRGYDFVSVDPSLVGAGEDPGPRDNDPIDGYGHGTHVAGIIGAVPNNGMGIAGINWYSKIMALRAGFRDTSGNGSLADSDAADAIRYAADNSARVINMSWGGYIISSLIRDAIDYAYALGAVLVASAGNNGNDKPFYPAAFPKVIGVSATDQFDQRSIWPSSWSASNYGSWIDVAAPGTSILSLRASGTDMYGDGTHIIDSIYYLADGTSMASPFVAGLSSLVFSRDNTLSNEEVKQVIRNNGVDLGGPGFDVYFGYGRINANETIRNTRVFPTAIITSPLPNAIRSRIVPIMGTAAGRDFLQYSIYYGTGSEPITWTPFYSSFLPVSNGLLSNFDTTSFVSGIYTIKLATASIITPTLAEDRVSIIIDNNLLPGWPVELDIGYFPSPSTLIDIDNDGYLEVLVSGDPKITLSGKTYVFHHDGSPVSGWPKPHGTSNCPPTVGDIEGNGDAEIVVAGRVLALYNYDGTLESGWPLDLGNSVESTPTLADLDGDNELEIMMGAKAALGELFGKFYAFHSDGTYVDGWPQIIGGNIWQSSPAVGDIDGDGDLEVVVGADDGNIYIWNHDGTFESGWPKSIIGTIRTSSPVLADVDGDGDLEIFIGNNDVASNDSRVYGWHHNGTTIDGWPISRREDGGHLGGINNFAVGDIDGDGDLEILAGEAMGASGGFVHAWHHNGVAVSNWPRPTSDWIWGSPVIGDINGDGDMEIVAGSRDGLLYAWHHNGRSVDGFPKITEGQILISPALGDIDNDGDIEIVVGSIAAGLSDSKIYIWDFPGVYTPATAPWPQFQHDARHTGNYQADVIPPAITHIPVTSATISTNIPISADITDNIAVRMARIWYKNTTSSTYDFIAMTNTGGSTWQGVIPSTVVTMDGVQYYLVAHDTSINPAINPLGAPDLGVYNIRVIDNLPPTFLHSPVTTTNACQDLSVSALIRDNVDSAVSAELFYKPIPISSWFLSPMSHVGETYSATIPASIITPPGLQYYLRATDSSSNSATLPAGAPTISTYVVAVTDTTDPIITHMPVTSINFGEDLTLITTVTDECGIRNVQAYYRTTGEDAWWSTSMSGSGDTFSTIIPNSEITLVGLDYYLQATDSNSNASASPADAPANFYHVEVIPPAADADSDGDSDADFEADIDADYEADIPDDAYDGGIDADAPQDAPSEEEDFPRPTGGCGCSVIM
jgi:subtilisin family serine protease